MAKVKTQQYRFDNEVYSAASYDAPIGRVEPGDVREFPSAPDFHWTLVVEDAPAPAAKPAPAPAPAPVATPEPEVSAPVEADADPAIEEK